MVDNFPKEGSINCIPYDIIDYLNKSNRIINSSYSEEYVAIAWNEISWWYLKNKNNSKKPIYTVSTIRKLINKTIIIEIW
jgi:hypothetical protein